MRGAAEERSEIIEAMLDPGFYPGEPTRAELRETHISWVLLVDGRAYKVKKPLRLPFLDYSTLELRHEMCREEVRLNRRLAPDYYVGVRAIASRDGGLALADEDDPGAVEYAVEMLAVPERRTLSSLVESGELQPAEVDAVGSRLAAFHRDAPVASDPRAAISHLVGSLKENHDTLTSVGPPDLPPDRLAAAERFTHALLAARRSDLEDRAGRGLAREGHGDLRAEHVIVTDPVQVYDCVEFDPALRQIDVAADLAFLVMDLARLGVTATADRLVGAYRDAGGDPGDDALLAFLASYRAWVRTKVACLRAREDGVDARRRGEAIAEAGELLALGHRFAWRARLPLLLFVCGVAASGKSTLAVELGSVSGLPVLASDRVRKRLAGIGPTERAAPAAYADEFNRRTYRELGALAARAVAEHGGAIVDATARNRGDRDAFREGLGAVADVAPVLFAECRAPPEVLRRRAARRGHQAAAVSDAGPEVVERQIGAFEPLEEVSPRAFAAIRTDAPLAEAVRAAEALADRAPGLATGPERGSPADE